MLTGNFHILQVKIIRMRSALYIIYIPETKSAVGQTYWLLFCLTSSKMTPIPPEIKQQQNTEKQQQQKQQMHAQKRHSTQRVHVCVYVCVGMCVWVHVCVCVCVCTHSHTVLDREGNMMFASRALIQ